MERRKSQQNSVFWPKKSEKKLPYFPNIVVRFHSRWAFVNTCSSFLRYDPSQLPCLRGSFGPRSGAGDVVGVLYKQSPMHCRLYKHLGKLCKRSLVFASLADCGAIELHTCTCHIYFTFIYDLSINWFIQKNFLTLTLCSLRSGSAF